MQVERVSVSLQKKANKDRSIERKWKTCGVARGSTDNTVRRGRTLKNHAKLRKLGTEAQILYDFIYTKYLQQANSESGIEVTRGWKRGTGSWC